MGWLHGRAQRNEARADKHTNSATQPHIRAHSFTSLHSLLHSPLHAKNPKRQPHLSLTLGSAPPSSRARTVVELPRPQAQWSGEMPFSSAVISALKLSNASTAAACAPGAGIQQNPRQQQWDWWSASNKGVWQQQGGEGNGYCCASLHDATYPWRP